MTQTSGKCTDEVKEQEERVNVLRYMTEQNGIAYYEAQRKYLDVQEKYAAENLKLKQMKETN